MFIMYYVYGSVHIIPTCRVYRYYDIMACRWITNSVHLVSPSLDVYMGIELNSTVEALILMVI